MIDRYTVFGLACLHFIPIFAFIYLQNEILLFQKIFLNIEKNFLTLITTLISFVIILLNILFIQPIIQIFSSFILIFTLSLNANYTYKDYTIDEGYYVSIPYFILYSCFIFFLSINEYPYYSLNSFEILFLLSLSLIFYSLFLLSRYSRIEFHNNYFNYLACFGLILSTVNLILILNSKKSNYSFVSILSHQLIHIYFYLTHLLSVKFELNSM